MNSLVKKNILGIDITDASEKEILEYVFDFMEHSREKLYIVTPNPEMVMLSRRHKEFRDMLNRAEVSLCDGVGLFQAARWLGKPLKKRIAGTDFMVELCKESVKKTVTVGFLGGRRGVAERTAECLVKKYPELRVNFIGEEWSPEGFDLAKNLSVSSSMYHVSRNVASHNTKYVIPDTEVDILFVAYGFPKQEIWMAEHLEKLPVRVMIGVGGAFDYISGEVVRAPGFMRNLGLEWLYRLIRQPWRLKRQLVLPQFVLLVLREKFRKSS